MKPIEYEIEEIGFWANGENINEKKTQLTEEDFNIENDDDFHGKVLVKSCIFYNFFDQVRVG